MLLRMAELTGTEKFLFYLATGLPVECKTERGRMTLTSKFPFDVKWEDGRGFVVSVLQTEPAADDVTFVDWAVTVFELQRLLSLLPPTLRAAFRRASLQLAPGRQSSGPAPRPGRLQKPWFPRERAVLETHG